MTHRHRQQNQGVALITAMLIVALASIAAVAVVSRQQFDIRRSANLINGDQAYQLALGAETFAKQILTRDLTKGILNNDALSEDWALPIQNQDVEGGRVSGYIEDLQGRYNLNNLVDVSTTGTGTVYTTNNDEVERFKILLKELAIPDDFAYVVADWIDTDINQNILGGREDTYYTGLQPAYRTANVPMSSVSELRLLLTDDHFKPEFFAQLEPYVCALPPRTKINVNTASAKVLITLSSNLRLSAAETLVEEVKTRAKAKGKPFDKGSFETELTSIGGLNATDINNIRDLWDVQSNYFLLSAETLFGKGQVHLYSELKRTAASAPTPSVPAAPSKISVIYRAQGVL